MYSLTLLSLNKYLPLVGLKVESFGGLLGSAYAIGLFPGCSFQKGIEQDDSKKAYQICKTLSKSGKRKTSVFKDNNDGIFTNSTAVNQRAEYCKNLSIVQLNTDDSILKKRPDYNL